jgi:CRISPR-associated endonuclease Cas1
MSVQPTRACVSPDPRVLVIDDYDFTLTVRRGHVVVRSGGNDRVISRLEAAKTRNGIARIIILAHVGTVSMEVIRWAAALDIAIFQVSRDGTIGFISPGASSSDARIIRQQVLAQPGMPGEHLGLELTRKLLTAKLQGQRDIIRDLFRTDTTAIERQISAVTAAGDLRGMLAAEGNAAMPYWKTWQDHVFVPWDVEAMRYIPGHWSRFGGRAGINTVANGYSNTSNRNAVDFTSACLNYAYKICETEAMYACHILGLHPGIGIGHGTHDGKPGMALDIIEPLRPIADRVVLSYLDYGSGIPLGDDGKPAYISKECAYELDNGTCRLFPPMTTRLATAVSMAVAGEAMRYAEQAVKAIAPGTNAMLNAPKDVRLRNRPVTAGKLSPDITPADLIPGHVREYVSALLPVRVTSGVPVDTWTVLAGIIAHDVYGASWQSVEVLGIDSRTCRARLAQWEETGVWPKIRAEITRPGVSQG